MTITTALLVRVVRLIKHTHGFELDLTYCLEVFANCALRDVGTLSFHNGDSLRLKE